jgi:hypothetical protein
VGAASLSSFLYLGFGMFYGGGGMMSLLPYFWEREGLCDGISNGCGVGRGWQVSGSSVLWPTAVDLCSNPTLREMAADGCSSSKRAWVMLLGDNSCGFNNVLHLL